MGKINTTIQLIKKNILEIEENYPDLNSTGLSQGKAESIPQVEYDDWT